ncbi:rod shape-determining protein MreD [Sphingomonas sp.]|uniref:rod shape-determining protein MreD n=1 Tax=Sphingomonas sp. TaxID=28214 RepID=UPI0025FBC826|nr:rod shape-determining protein MreD [Sphingomonas sp.]
MIALRRRSSFGPPPGAVERQIVPILSVMIASLTPLLPEIWTAPILPPFGFMVLLGWRLLRDDLWPVWVALPLGLFDDIFSGQPLGSAMALWTIAFLVIDVIDSRLVWRDHWQDWGIAALAIAGELVLALGIAHITGGAMPVLLLLPQILVSVLLFPIVARLCATLDRFRLAR